VKAYKKILIGAGISTAIGAALGTASYAITKKLVKTALERSDVGKDDKSEAKKRLSRSSKSVELAELQKNAAEKLISAGLEEVSIKTPDGETLVGHIRYAHEPKRTVIAFHGWRSSWTRDFGMIADFWDDAGCNVVFVEQRGQNASSGKYMGFGLLERFDCVEWVKYVKSNEKLKDLPIYLAGLSMGATTVLMATGLDMPSGVHGVIADCGFTSPHAIWKHVVENNVHFSYFDKIADKMCKRRIKMGTKDYSCAEALSKNEIPVLFIHGSDDKFVPVWMTYENYKAAKGKKRLLIVPGAGHGMSRVVDTEAYDRAVLDFWRDFD